MKPSNANTRHGHARKTGWTKTYQAWHDMRARCRNPKYRQYSDYGGRGIKICGRWGDYANFLADLGEAPIGTSLDRIDNNGHYSPDNCRWATRVEQERNKRNNVRIFHDSRTLCLAEWSRITGIPAHRIRRRMQSGFPLGVVFYPGKLRSGHLAKHSAVPDVMLLSNKGKPMSFWHEVEKVKDRVHAALAVAKPVVETAQKDLKPLEVIPGAVGTVAVVADHGVSAIMLLIAEVESLLAAVPNADSVPPPPAA